MRSWLAIVVGLGLSAGCNSLKVDLQEDVTPGRVVAILPFEGEAPTKDRELVRQLLRDQLQARSVAVLENAHVDHVLSRHGWLGDPDQFAVEPDAIPAIADALGVDGVIRGSGFAYKRVNALLIYRRGIRGELHWDQQDGQGYWTVSYKASHTGGLIVQRGQLFSAISDTVESSSSREWVRLAVKYVESVLDTLPGYPSEGLPAPVTPAVDGATVTRTRTGSETRFRFDVRATAGAHVRADLPPSVEGLPLSEVRPGVYSGDYIAVRGDGTADTSVAHVHVRDRFGHESFEDQVPITTGGTP